MIGILVCLFTTSILLLILLPQISCLLIKYLCGLDVISFKMYTFNSYKAFLLKINLNNKLWGIKDFIIYIPSITVKFNIKMFKVIVQTSNMEIFFVHNNFQLHKVKIIEGLMEPNLIANFFQFITRNSKYTHTNSKDLMKNYGKLMKKYMKNNDVQQKNKQKQQATRNSQMFTLLQGTFHFIIMMVFQFLQIRLTENTVNFVSSIPNIPVERKQKDQKNFERAQQFNHEINFQTRSLRKKSLLLLRNLSQQTLKVNQLSLKIAIINHFQQQIQINCPKFQVINWDHPSQPMVKGNQFYLGIKIPFTLQILQSLKSIQYSVKVDSLDFNTVPKDYEMMLSQKSFSFSLQKIQNLLLNNLKVQNTVQKKNEDSNQILKQQTTFTVQISKINLTMQSLYEVNIDNEQACEYLSNISEARLTLTEIAFKSKQFKISQSILKINKFRNSCQGKATPRFSSSIQSPMILIPNIVFSFTQKSTKVYHNPTQLYCGKEELALLGKLFNLINQRMRFDEFNPQIYLKVFGKFLDFQHNRSFKEEKQRGLAPSQTTNKQSVNKDKKQIEPTKTMNFVDYFAYFCFIQKCQDPSIGVSIPFRQEQQNEQAKSEQFISQDAIFQQNQFLYEPSSLTFKILIQNLEHTLYLANCSYKQVMKSEEFQHILSVPSLDLNYSQTKQFGIKQLKMIFRQIPTLNELALFVQSVNMCQTQQTLIQYLNGWIVVKKLLQINGGEKAQNPQLQKVMPGNKKISKKTITIKKLQFQYQKQQVLIKKIQLQKTTLPNNKINRLYFSMDRFEFNTKLMKSANFPLKKVPQKKSNLYKKQATGKPAFRIPVTFSKTNPKQHKAELNSGEDKSKVQVIHNLLTFQSLTINVTLQNFNKKIARRKGFSIQKQKSLIHLKSPQIILPHYDISQKLLNVMKSYIELGPHINAYIKDTTQDEFLKIKRNIKDFLIQPDCLHLKVTNLGVVIEQQPLNTHLQNYNRFIREFLSKVDPKKINSISEIELISFLSKNKRDSKLCKLNIKEISFQIYPLETVSNNIKQSVNQWISNFKSKLQFQIKQSFRSQKYIQNNQIRLRKVQAAEYKIGIRHMEFQMRDYPDSIVSLNQFNFKISCIKTSNIFNLRNYFFIGQLKFGKMNINVGLNMLSGLLQLRKKVNSYKQILNRFQNTQQFVSNFKQANLRRKHNLIIQQKKFQRGYQPWWHIMFNSSQWKFHTIKQPTKINLYTGTTPYEKECFEIILGNFQCKSELAKTVFKMKDLQIKLLQNKIICLNDFFTNFEISYDQNKNFHILADIFSQNAGKILLSKNTVHYISTIRQLRNDWLIIYGLHAQNSYEDEEMLKKKQRMNYLQLIHLTANKMIEEDGRNVSILSAIKEVQLKVNIHQFNLGVSNLQQGVELGLQRFKFDHQITAYKKIKNQWQTVKSSLQVQKIWGNLSSDKSLQSSARLSEHLKQNQDNVFLAARGLKLNFNKYKILKETQKQLGVSFIRKFMLVESIKLAVSIKIKKSIQQLVDSFSPGTLKKQFQEKNKVIIKDETLTPIEKFKSAIWKVIRINKLKRRKSFGIKNYNFYAQIGKIQFVLRSDKNSIIVDSLKQVRFNVSKNYRQNDQCFRNPITNIYLRLTDVQINLIQSCKNYIVNLLSKNYQQKQTPQQKRLKLSYSENLQLQINIQSGEAGAYQKNQSRGKFLLSNGSIQLTQRTKSILTEMIEFITQFTNNKQKLKMKYKKSHDKFNELQNNGRDILKNKIESAYKEIVGQKNQRLAFKWVFQIRNTDIYLIVPVQEKIKFQMDSVSFLTISKPFLKIDSKLISAQLNFYNNQKIQKTFQANDLTVYNLFQKQQSLFYKVISMNHTDNLALYMTAQSYDVNPLSSITWELYNDIKIHVNPIKIRVTQKLYLKFYQFMFPESAISKRSTEQQKNKNQVSENYEQKFIPDYIRKLSMDEIKVQVWYETESLLKRMQGISVGLNSYQLQKCFSTKKQLFDQWVKFVLKQMAGQIFNVLGQKFFGSSQKIDNQL